jgi:hypothetical protein
MGTYPAMALQVQPPQQPDLIGNLTKLLGYRAAQQNIQSGQLENQQRQMQIEAMQRDQQDSQAIQQALAANPSATYGDVLPQLRGKIQPKMWAQLAEADQKIKKGYSDQSKDDLANAEAQHKQYGEIYNNVMNMPDQQVTANWPQIAQAIQSVPGNKIPVDPSQPMTKQQIAQFGPMLSLNEAYLQGEQEKRKTGAEIAEKQAQADKARWEMQHGPITDQSRFIQDYMSTHGLADTPANRQKGFGEYNRLTKIQPAQVRVEGFGSIRQNQVYDTQTGQTIYMDSNSLNAANANEPGRYRAPQFTPEAIIEQQTGKTFGPGGKGSEEVLAFNTAIQHADLLQQAATALSNGDVRTLNKIGNTLGVQFGSDKATNFKVIANAYSREVTKALSGGHITDAEIKEQGATIPTDASPTQILGAVNSYRSLMQSKMNLRKQQFESGRQGQPAFQGSGGGHVIRLNGRRYQYNGTRSSRIPDRRRALLFLLARSWRQRHSNPHLLDP